MPNLHRDFVDLLMFLFNEPELRLFLRKFIGREITDNISGLGATPAEVFHQTVTACEQRGLIDADLLGILGAIRPDKLTKIQSFATQHGFALSKQPKRLHLRHVDGSTTGIRRVFISYSRDDSGWALATANALAHVDVEVSMDVLSFASGEDWLARIRQELDRVDRVILGWSRSASVSPYVKLEYEQALQVRTEESVDRFLVVELLDDTPLPAALAPLNAVRSSYQSATDSQVLLDHLKKEDRLAFLRILESLARR